MNKIENADALRKYIFNSKNIKTISWLKQHIDELDDDQEVLLMSKEQTLPMKIWKAAQTDEELDFEEKAELEAFKQVFPEFK